MVANRLLNQHRQSILDLAQQHRVRNIRVFGSAASGEMSADSDVDLLVDLEPEATLIDLGSLLVDLEELLGRRVDIVTSEAIHSAIRDQILREAVPL
jgi:uncharacterized protein